jgi:hypothetical protein
MPVKKAQSAAIKKMEAKIATLEEEIAGMKATLTTMEKNQAQLIAMFERSLNKTVITEETSVRCNSNLEFGWGVTQTYKTGL